MNDEHNNKEQENDNEQTDFYDYYGHKRSDFLWA